MSAERDNAAERSLDDLAHGDPGTRRMLRESLQQLADQAQSAELREMAQSVLAGRTTLRQAALSQAYGSALSERVEAFVHEYQSMAPDERAALVEQGREHLDRLARDESDEQARAASSPLSD